MAEQPRNPTSREARPTLFTHIARIASGVVAIGIILLGLLYLHPDSPRFGSIRCTPPSEAPGIVRQRGDFCAWLFQPHYEDPPYRSQVKESTTMVYCYPSYGGIYIAKGLSAVDLEYLGIPRLNATSPRSYDPAEEDAFCNKFLRFQPRWYVNYNNYEYENLNSDNELFVETPDAEDVVWDTCSPTTGGLWVWRSTKQEREKVKDDGKETPHKIGTTYNALNMDEKCSILKAAGARFYENAEDWVEWKPANEKIERRKKLLHLYRLWWEHGCDFELDMDDLDMASNWLKDYYDLYEELSVKPDRVMAMEEAENTEKSEL